jgi:hypothetical protein
MKITENLFRDFLNCAQKAYLLLKGEAGQKSDYEILQNELHDAYVQNIYGNGAYAGHLPKSVEFARGSVSCRELLRDIKLDYEDISLLCDGIIKNTSDATNAGYYYSPIIFSHKYKIVEKDRYILAFRALLAFSDCLLSTRDHLLYS